MPSKITEIKPGVNVEPLQDAIAKADYSLDEVLAEYIDNSISAARPGVPVTVNITINGDIFKYDDNGHGIERDKLENALTIGSLQSYSAAINMNEHGFGFKQAIYSMGTFMSLQSKTVSGDSYNIKGNADLKYGISLNKKIVINEKSELSTPGTSFQLKLNKKHLDEFNQKEKLQTVASRLGAKYQDLLKEHTLEIRLSVQGQGLIIKPHTQFHWNFNTGKEGPLLDKIYKGTKGNWEARVIVGYAPDPKKEGHIYTNSKHIPVSDNMTYARSIGHSGFDLKVGLRVIEHNAKQLSEKMNPREILIRSHGESNGIQGTIHFIKGFKTLTTKNRMAHTDELTELYKQINVDTRSVEAAVKIHEASLKRKYTQQSAIVSILKNATVHKKRANRLVTVDKELYKNTNIKHASIDKTTNTLYVEPISDLKFSNSILVDLHEASMKHIVEPNPLGLIKNIKRIVTIIKQTPTNSLIQFAAMIPQVCKISQKYVNDIKHNDLLTPDELAGHLASSMNFK